MITILPWTWSLCCQPQWLCPRVHVQPHMESDKDPTHSWHYEHQSGKFHSRAFQTWHQNPEVWDEQSTRVCAVLQTFPLPKPLPGTQNPEEVVIPDWFLPFLTANWEGNIRWYFFTILMILMIFHHFLDSSNFKLSSVILQIDLRLSSDIFWFQNFFRFQIFFRFQNVFRFQNTFRLISECLQIIFRLTSECFRKLQIGFRMSSEFLQVVQIDFRFQNLFQIASECLQNASECLQILLKLFSDLSSDLLTIK